LHPEDRHLRGNAAFIYAWLGDPRGFDVIAAILSDRSEGLSVKVFRAAAGPFKGK
jgi:hypothetical protein